MSNNKIQTMGQIPSRFGMPTHGLRLGVYVGTDGLHHQCARCPPIDRVAARIWGAFPGTSAWRPPTC